MSEWMDLAALVGWLLALIFWVRWKMSRYEHAQDAWYLRQAIEQHGPFSVRLIDDE